MSERREDLMARVCEAYWQEEPAGTRAALERVVATVQNHTLAIIEEIKSDYPDAGLDNGATRDGWEMACRRIAEQVTAAVALAVSERDGGRP